ncbi:hypothetical protein D3C84_443930 [compost metagenome]
MSACPATSRLPPAKPWMMRSAISSSNRAVMAAMPQARPMARVAPMITRQGGKRLSSQGAIMNPMSFSAVYPTSSQANSSGVAWVSPMMSLRPRARTVLAVASVSVASTTPASRRMLVRAPALLGEMAAALVMSLFPLRFQPVRTGPARCGPAADC